MDNEKYSRLVQRLEELAATSPARYTAGVIGMTLLGFAIFGLAIGMALFSVALLVGLGFLAVFTGAKGLLLIFKLGKFIYLLLLPLLLMLKSSVKLMFTRFPPPEGRAIEPGDAPRLFQRLGKIQARMNGPRIHKVLLTDELNAAIVQHPKLGLFGWEENYLILGLPLLQVLSEKEALAVVTHEYGHLSGHHSRFGAFIYRLRSSWGKLQSMSEEWGDPGSRLLSWLFGWYAPYFNAYTFVLARQNEYVADNCAAELLGKENAGSALKRIEAIAYFEDMEYYPALEQKVASEQKPITFRSSFRANLAHNKLTQETTAQYLEMASQVKTGHFDTHPSLTDRLSAMGVSSLTLDKPAIEPLGSSAAMLWFGKNLLKIQMEMDKAWHENVSERWLERHEYLKGSAERLSELERRSRPTTDEQWERIKLLDKLRPETDQLPYLDALLAEFPEHAGALFRRGALLLEREDESGIQSLEKAMAVDAYCTMPACELAQQYYSEKSPELSAKYRERWKQRYIFEEQINAERESLSPKARVCAADLDEQTMDALYRIVRDHGKHIRRAYVLKRTLEADNSLHDYILAFESSIFSPVDRGPGIIKRLNKAEFPLPMFLVHLNTNPYSKFKKPIKKQNIQPFFTR